MNQEQAKDTAHPASRFQTYMIVAVLLTILTGLELLIAGSGLSHILMYPLLIFVSGSKFALIALFYMHLRYDAIGFSAIFGPLILLGTLIVLILELLLMVFYQRGGF